MSTGDTFSHVSKHVMSFCLGSALTAKWSGHPDKARGLHGFCSGVRESEVTCRGVSHVVSKCVCVCDLECTALKVHASSL